MRLLARPRDWLALLAAALLACAAAQAAAGAGDALPALALATAGDAKTAVASPALPPMADLRADAVRARAEGKPVVLLFSLPDCKYCAEVRQNYLLPLVRDAEPAKRPLIREALMTGEQSITGFDGKPTTPRQLAEHYHVRVSPTLLFVDSEGHPLVAPLVGGDTSGMYGAYLDNALAEAQGKLK